jgi:hypothetical protein
MEEDPRMTAPNEPAGPAAPDFAQYPIHRRVLMGYLSALIPTILIALMAVMGFSGIQDELREVDAAVAEGSGADLEATLDRLEERTIAAKGMIVLTTSALLIAGVLMAVLAARSLRVALDQIMPAEAPAVPQKADRERK